MRSYVIDEELMKILWWSS